MSVADGLIGFRNSVTDFLLDPIFQSVKSIAGVLPLITVVLAHVVDLLLELFTKYAKLVLELCSKSLKGVIDSFGFSFGKVSIGLNLPRDVLKLCLLLLL